MPVHGSMFSHRGSSGLNCTYDKRREVVDKHEMLKKLEYIFELIEPVCEEHTSCYFEVNRGMDMFDDLIDQLRHEIKDGENVK